MQLKHVFWKNGIADLSSFPNYVQAMWFFPNYVQAMWFLYLCVADSVIYSSHVCFILSWPQSNQSAGPVSFLIFCPISIFLQASPVAGRSP